MQINSLLTLSVPHSDGKKHRFPCRITRAFTRLSDLSSLPPKYSIPTLFSCFWIYLQDHMDNFGFWLNFFSLLNMVVQTFCLMQHIKDLETSCCEDLYSKQLCQEVRGIKWSHLLTCPQVVTTRAL